MQFIWIILAGLCGTTAMVGVMGFIHRMNWANADMIRAIGSLFTRSKELAFWPGLILHYTAGICFAFLYAVLIGMAPVTDTSGMLLVGLGGGLFHGLVVGLLLAIEVAEHHPVEEFRSAGMGVVLSHIVGHVFYGFFVALGLALSGTQLRIFHDNIHGGALHSIQDPVVFTALWIVLFGVPALLVAFVLYSAFMAKVRSEAQAEEARKDGRKAA